MFIGQRTDFVSLKRCIYILSVLVIHYLHTVGGNSHKATAKNSEIPLSPFPLLCTAVFLHFLLSYTALNSCVPIPTGCLFFQIVLNSKTEVFNLKKKIQLSRCGGAQDRRLDDLEASLDYTLRPFQRKEKEVSYSSRNQHTPTHLFFSKTPPHLALMVLIFYFNHQSYNIHLI